MTSTERRFLPEVQALRAVAVALVVVYHVWPGRVPGGFIGVDVFFVISGYLISGHLAREYESTGRVRLLAFWSRRIRRLLPAAFLVLAVCAVLAFTILPSVVRVETLRQIAASAGYVLNWVLAADSVDYLAAGNVPTVVQHYWSLSVEEQFYIAWPLLLIALAWLVARVRGRGASSAALFGSLAGGIAVASFAASVWLTWFSPSVAYFATTTRAWEFATGALVAVVVGRWPGAIERLRTGRFVGATSVLTCGGLGIVALSAFVITGESGFPGWIAALPVVGTALVILGGAPRLRPLGALVRWRPVQFAGDISYSLYLWHWPLITTLVIVLGRRPSVIEGVGLIVASVVLAAATKYLVEDPARRWTLPTPVVAFAFALAGVVVFSGTWGATAAITNAVHAQQQAAELARIEDPAGCFGANAMLGTGACPDRFVLGSDVDLAAAANDLDYQNWCLTWFDEDWRSCEFGDTSSDTTWALVGDSHAASMVAAFDEYFRREGIRIVTFTRYGCSGLGYTRPDAVAGSLDDQQEVDCLTWSDRVREELVSRDDIDAVLYLNRTTSYSPETRGAFALTVADIETTWRTVLDSGKAVVVMKDWPRTAGDSIPVCLSAHVGETAPCSLARDVAMPPDIQDEAIAAFGGDVASIDLTDAFCDASTCYSVIGDVVVYADHNHISRTYSRTLMPYLGPLLRDATR